jgi:N6-adenosine-specific RNA methylase IME4
MRRRVCHEFSTIVIDPPWNETGGAPVDPNGWGGKARGADMHYPLMKTAAIPGAIISSGLFNPAENAHLYLWVTKSFLKDGLWVMEQLGFRYVTMLTWVKTDNRIGLGRYFRGRTEPCLFGVRGKGIEVCTDLKNVDDLILAPRTAHSRKPPESYLKIEQRSKGPYLEMFGRGSFDRDGWTVWGNEVVSVS